jgi:hypothetical protein
MATMPLTQAAIQRLAAMLSAGAPSATQPYDYSPPKRLPGLNSQVRSATQLETAVPPAPEQGPAPNFGLPPAASGAPAVSPEGLVNQNPPVPNPPLAAAPPAVTSASFGGAVPPPMPASIPVGAPPAAAPNPAAMPAPVGSDPSMADETVRQTLARVMKPKMLPAQWAANFGNLADQGG